MSSFLSLANGARPPLACMPQTSGSCGRKIDTCQEHAVSAPKRHCSEHTPLYVACCMVSPAGHKSAVPSPVPLRILDPTVCGARTRECHRQYRSHGGLAASPAQRQSFGAKPSPSHRASVRPLCPRRSGGHRVAWDVCHIAPCWATIIFGDSLERRSCTGPLRPSGTAALQRTARSAVEFAASAARPCRAQACQERRPFS